MAMQMWMKGFEVARLWKTILQPGDHGLPKETLLLMAPNADLWPGDELDIRTDGFTLQRGVKVHFAQLVCADDAEAAEATWNEACLEGRAFVARPRDPFVLEKHPQLQQLTA